MKHAEGIVHLSPHVLVSEECCSHELVMVMRVASRLPNVAKKQKSMFGQVTSEAPIQRAFQITPRHTRRESPPVSYVERTSLLLLYFISLDAAFLLHWSLIAVAPDQPGSKWPIPSSSLWVGPAINSLPPCLSELWFPFRILRGDPYALCL